MACPGCFAAVVDNFLSSSPTPVNYHIRMSLLYHIKWIASITSNKIGVWQLLMGPQLSQFY